MKSLIHYPVKVFATGFVVLTLLSIPLFWFRFWCQTSLVVRMPSEARDVSITPSGLVPPELENDPNVVNRSRVSARMIVGPFFLGIADYFLARFPGGRHSNIYYYDKKDEDWMYFDEETGQIVCRYTGVQRMPDKTILKKKVQLYVGPEGISESPGKNLGRFTSPVVSISLWLTLYDKKLRRFFYFDLDERTVVKGPQLPKDDTHKPIDIGILRKGYEFESLNWSPPQVRASEEDIKERRSSSYELPPIVRRYYRYPSGQYLLVLDESGRIDLLDRETLEFAGTAGWLPAPKTFFPSKEVVTPKDLLSYDVLPLALDTDQKYRGMFAVSVSREGTAMALAVFDEKGVQIKTEHTKLRKYRGRSADVDSSKAVFFEAPWAPVSTIGIYLAENLHPLLLSLVSYFTADSFEAAAGHRALFILPNSFVAMKGRDVSENTAERIITALLLMLPSIILAILLAWRVNIDATTVGLSENARLCWMIGTIAFGLTAYITYRLTRPKITLVTCQNCGNLRRPDMNRCHRCGSKWHIPELTPPAWRVLGRSEQVYEGLPAEEAEAE